MSAVGCVKFTSEPKNELSDDPIAFTTPIVKPITKVADKIDYPESSTFGVFGVHYPSGTFSGWTTTPGAVTYIDGVEFRYDASIDDYTHGSGAWISDPAYFWPKFGKMAFAACFPYSVKEQYGNDFKYDAKGLSIIGFTTGDTDGVDLMYSDRVYDKYSSRGTNIKYDGIDITFHHALAALAFKAASTDVGVKVSVTKIAIWGISKKGNFSENVNENSDSPSTYQSAPEWNISTTDVYTETDPLIVTSDQLYIIPQNIDMAKMKVYYTIQVGDATPVPAVSNNLDLSGHKIKDSTENLYIWEMAHRYVYNLQISRLVPIRFSVDVLKWEEDIKH